MADLRRILWLASFPKSGNTWLRALLANYFMPKDQAPGINELGRFTTSDMRQDFYDRAAGKRFVAETTEDWLAMRQKTLRLIASSREGAHFVKTHSRVDKIKGFSLIPPEITVGAVYVMRNPFDVAASYARHIGVPLNDAIAMMLNKDAVTGTDTRILEVLGRWDDHAISWLDAPGLARHLVRYEDMIDHTEGTIRELLVFLKAPVKDGDLRRAIRASSFRELQKQEEKSGFRERPPAAKKFFHSGQTGGWKEALSPEHVSRLRSGFLPALERFYPELLEETEEFANAV